MTWLRSALGSLVSLEISLPFKVVYMRDSASVCLVTLSRTAGWVAGGRLAAGWLAVTISACVRGDSQPHRESRISNKLKRLMEKSRVNQLPAVCGIGPFR
jgi:hypothetical protein